MQRSSTIMFRRLTYCAAGAALLVAGLAACSNDDNSDADADVTSDTSHNDADVAFAQEMIPHHAQAIEMSELVPDRAESPEVQALAEDIEAAQQPEIDLMSDMLVGWDEDVPDIEGSDGEGSDGGHEGHGADDMPGMMSHDEMAELDAATGADFDRMWLTMMIEHHEGAITMSEDVLADGTDTDVGHLAEEIIDVQQAEIDQMQGLLEGLPS